MCLPVKNLSVVILISKLDSGSRKGNPCLTSAKFFDQIVLFESFEILPKKFSQGVLRTFGSQPVLNPEESGCEMTPEGFRGTYPTGKRVLLLFTIIQSNTKNEYNCYKFFLPTSRQNAQTFISGYSHLTTATFIEQFI
jgi:hypothetical protein